MSNNDFPWEVISPGFSSFPYRVRQACVSKTARETDYRGNHTYEEMMTQQIEGCTRSFSPVLQLQQLLHPTINQLVAINTSSPLIDLRETRFKDGEVD